MTGQPNRGIPAGLLFAAPSGERYYNEAASRLDSNGSAVVNVKAQTTGAQANLTSGAELAIVSAIPPGVDSVATVRDGGISGGTDAETDEEYLARVLAWLRNPARYGKPGDFAAWAVDSSPEVSSAWELKNFGPLGVLLIQVINGNQRDGVNAVGGLDTVRDYLKTVAPPIIFTVRSPSIIQMTPSVSLPPREDTLANRDLVDSRMRSWLQVIAEPGVQITAGALRLAAIDGVTITDIAVTLNGSTTGIITTTVLEYPYLKELLWE